MPFYRIKTYYLALSENKLEIMQYFVGKLTRKGWKVKAVNLWLSTIEDLKDLALSSKTNQLVFDIVSKNKTVILTDYYNSADYYRIRVNYLRKTHNLQYFLIFSLLSYTSLNPLDYVIFMALENVCPIVVFTKEQKARNLNFIPIYAKHRRNIKFGVSWILLTARVNARHLSQYPSKISGELWKAAHNSPESIAIQLKLHYYSLAYRNLHFVRNKKFFKG